MVFAKRRSAHPTALAYIEHFHRQSDKTWLLTVLDDPAASLFLLSLKCSIAVAEIYDKVEFG